jgi:energy-coupling factor transporter ATP-binding protein EcfA2
MARINREGVAILFIEQHVERALALAHRGFVLESGRTVLQGRSAELLHARAEPVLVDRPFCRVGGDDRSAAVRATHLERPVSRNLHDRSKAAPRGRRD